MSNHELRRWLMKEVHGVDIPRKPPKKASALGTPKVARSWKYRAWIRSLPCAVCGNTPSEAAHTASDGGMSLKASDFSCVPLCADCHTQGTYAYHRLNRQQFELHHSLDLKALVKRLNGLWFDPENRVA